MSVLGLVFLVAIAGAGVSQAADDDRPSSCGVELLADGAALVTWSGGGDWVNIVRNGERLLTTSIREEGSRFTDVRPPGGATTYGVGVGDFGGLTGETLVCGTVQTQANLPLESVPLCRVVLRNHFDQAAIEVEWDKVARATEYVVWSNGHQIHTTATASYYVPGRYDGVKTQHYAVSAKDGDELAPKTYCGKIVPEDVGNGGDPGHTCSATALADGTVDVTFSHSGQVRIWRNGVLWANPFSDEVQGQLIDNWPLTGTATYTLRALDQIGQEVGETFTCGTVDADEAAPIKPVTECSVTLLNDNRINVSWQPSPRVTEYVIWNNGRQLAEQTDITNFTSADPYTGGTTQHFAVSAKRDTVITPKTYCGKVVTEDVPVTPTQAACSVIRDVSVRTFEVRWTGMDSGEVVVRRSVDGSAVYWRGRTSADQFTDSYRAGDVRYQIAIRNSDGTTGPAIGCTLLS